jgi:hypothetical protein
MLAINLVPSTLRRRQRHDDVMSGELDPYRLPPNAVRQLSALKGDDHGLLAPDGERGDALLVACALAALAAIVPTLLFVPGARWWLGGAIACAIGAFSLAHESSWEWLAKLLFPASACLLVATVIACIERGPMESLCAVAGAVAIGTLTYVGKRVGRWKERRARQLHSLYELQQAADRFDKLVQALGVADSVQSVLGQAPSQADRQRALQVLAINRENLVRALRVERILRENRKLLADVGAGAIQEALLPMEAVRIDARASEYARIVTENLAIAAEVQTAFDELTHAPSRRR